MNRLTSLRRRREIISRIPRNSAPTLARAVRIAPPDESVELSNAACTKCDGPIHWHPETWLFCPACTRLYPVPPTTPNEMRVYRHVERFRLDPANAEKKLTADLIFRRMNASGAVAARSIGWSTVVKHLSNLTHVRRLLVNRYDGLGYDLPGKAQTGAL